MRKCVATTGGGASDVVSRRYILRPRTWVSSTTFLIFLAANGAGSSRGTVRDKMADNWRTRFVVFSGDDGSRCAALCGSEEWGVGSKSDMSESQSDVTLDATRGDGGLQVLPRNCGIEMEVSVFTDALILGVELKLRLSVGAHKSLRVSGMNKGLALEYEVFESYTEPPRRAGGLRAPTVINNSPTPAPNPDEYTLSVRLPPNRAASPDEPLTLRLEACDLGPADVIGRNASVFIAPGRAGVTTQGGPLAPDPDSSSVVGDTWGASSDWPAAEGQGLGVGVETRSRGLVASWWEWAVRLLVLVTEQLTTGRSPLPGDYEGSLEDIGVEMPGNVDAGDGDGDGNFGVTGNGRVDGKPTARNGWVRDGRRLAERCSASCLQSSEQHCYNDPECESGGLGCNALDDPLCRFCGFSNFLDCNTGPTAAPVPTPSPTLSPDRKACDGWCLQHEIRPCFDDPSCRNGGIGCNAAGDFYCRFCGFADFVDCPNQPTPSPSPSSPAPTLAPTPFTPTLGPPPATPTISPSPSFSTLVPSPAATNLAPSPAATTLAPSPAATTVTPAPFASTLTPEPAIPVTPTTMAPRTSVPSEAPSSSPPPTGVPTDASTTSPTIQPIGMPTVLPTEAPTSVPTMSPAAPTVVEPTASPTVLPTSEPTLGPTVSAGELGPASVTGTISATGVPDDVVEANGEKAIFRDAVCSLVPSCLNGSESVTVDFGEEGQDRLLLTFPRRHRGRRLADFEDVLFEVSLPTTGGESEDGEPQTGSKQAAAMFNSVADEDARAAAADALGVGVDDLDFGDLTYFEGEKFTISNEFADVAASATEEDASTWATVIVGGILIAAVVLLSACAFCCLKRTVSKRIEKSRMSFGSPPRKAPLVPVEQEDEQMTRTGKVPGSGSSEAEVRRSSSYEEGPPTRRGSDDGSIISEKFMYTNPMLRERTGERKTGSPPNSDTDGLDLAKHYDGFHDGRSDVSSEPLHSATSNPMFSDEYQYLRGPSPPSTAGSDSARKTGGGSGGSGPSNWRSSTAALTSGSSSSVDTTSSFSFTPRSGSGYRAMTPMGSEHSSQFGGPPLYGVLSPVDENVEGRGENDVTTSSSARSNDSGDWTSQGNNTRFGRGGGGGDSNFSRSYDSAGSSMLDDEDSMFRAASPGSVTRPVQPLLASQSPVSESASTRTSRSSSFASPTPLTANGITMWMPGAGLQKGISAECLQTITASGGGEKERQAVREVVRKQRRRFARSLSQESFVNAPLLPMAEDPIAEESGSGSGSGSTRGKHLSKKKSSSLSPHRHRGPHKEADGPISSSGLESGEPSASPGSKASNAPLGSSLVGGQQGLSTWHVPEDFDSNRSDLSGASADAAGGYRGSGASTRSRGLHEKDSLEEAGDGGGDSVARVPTPAMAIALAQEEDIEDDGKPPIIARLPLSAAAPTGKAAKGLRFTSRGRAITRKMSSGSSGAPKSAVSDSSSFFDSPLVKENNSSRSHWGSAASEFGEVKSESEGAGDQRISKVPPRPPPPSAAAPGLPVAENSARNPIAVGAATAASNSARGEGGDDRRASAPKSERTPGSSKSSARSRRSSFAEYQSSGEIESEDGGDIFSNLRQHLANPSQPSGSYKREDSQESSVLSDDSMPPLIAVGALRPNSFSSRSSQSPASCQSAATSGSYAAGGRASDVVVEPRRSVKRMRSPSIESTSGSEVGTTVPFSLQPQVKSDHERTASRESVLPAMAWGTRVGNDTYGATATTGALVAKDKAFAAKPAAAAAQVDAVGRGMLEMATLHQKLFTRGQGSQSSGLSSSSGESKRRVVSG